ncbi:MAG: hypothetical protein P9L99_14600 [Candidatus Lernaella stagnicola]|nr:hypothetical protein [Candidatus Lernaella stagnicola]
MTRAPDYLAFIDSEYQRFLASAPTEPSAVRRRMLALLGLAERWQARAKTPLFIVDTDSGYVMRDTVLRGTAVAVGRPVRPNGDVVVFALGHGENGATALESRIAKALLDGGFVVFAPDLPACDPAHGVDEAVAADRLALGGFTLTGMRLYHLTRAVDLAIYAEKPNQLFVVGHSVGGKSGVVIIDAQTNAKSPPSTGEETLAILHRIKRDTHVPRRPLELIGRTVPGMEVLQVLALHRYLRTQPDIDAGQIRLSPRLGQRDGDPVGSTWWAAMLEPSLGQAVVLRPTSPDALASGRVDAIVPGLAALGMACELRLE